MLTACLCRKLYEPALFPTTGPEANPSEEIFARVFGTSRADVCTFGFKASPRHALRLHALQRGYAKVGTRVRFYTHTAVQTSDGNVTFFMGGNPDPNDIDGAASTYPNTGDKAVTVSGMDVAAWMLREVVNRTLPDGDGPAPAILMKSDIENNDMAVLSRMLDLGALCHVTEVYGEHMDDAWLADTRAALRERGCSTVITPADDETGQGGSAYLSLPLPGEDAPAMTLNDE